MRETAAGMNTINVMKSSKKLNVNFIYMNSFLDKVFIFSREPKWGFQIAWFFKKGLKF